jgi:hypothetical protein
MEPSEFEHKLKKFKEMPYPSNSKSIDEELISNLNLTKTQLVGLLLKYSKGILEVHERKLFNDLSYDLLSDFIKIPDSETELKKHFGLLVEITKEAKLTR